MTMLPIGPQYPASSTNTSPEKERGRQKHQGRRGSATLPTPPWKHLLPLALGDSTSCCWNMSPGVPVWAASCCLVHPASSVLSVPLLSGSKMERVCRGPLPSHSCSFSPFVLWLPGATVPWVGSPLLCHWICLRDRFAAVLHKAGLDALHTSGAGRRMRA